MGLFKFIINAAVLVPKEIEELFKEETRSTIPQNRGYQTQSQNVNVRGLEKRVKVQEDGPIL
ncbi:MAG: hypothetical protein RR922_00325 [Clostridia bacterium]